jgi:amino acid adenylation domain-containing protein
MAERSGSTRTAEEKRQLLADLLGAQQEQRQAGRIGPVSFAQRRLWFLDQLAPGSVGYNVPIALRIERPLDVRALTSALRQVVRRHEVLRTRFIDVAGVPMQEILPPFEVELETRDLSRETDLSAAVSDAATSEARRPFDLTTGPLLRAVLVRLGDADHVLLLTIHHIVFDGSSSVLLFRELDVLYRAFTSGGIADLPDLPFQYLDYAVWQRNWLQGEVLDAQLAYWRRQLEGGSAILSLPLAQARPEYRGNRRGAAQPVALSESLIGALRQLGASEGVTLFTTLLAGFKMLLARYTGQADVTVGIPVSRSRSEVENLIGFFVNTLVLRTDVGESPSFRELVRRVGAVTRGALAHQDLPFEKLVQELSPDRDSSFLPIFQVLFNYQDTSVERVFLPAIGGRLMLFDSGITRFDLELNLFGMSRGVEGAWGYDRDLFDAGTMARMVRHYRRLLEESAAHPDRPFQALSLLDADERRQVLVDWNQTASRHESERLPERFERLAARSPHAEAIVFEGEGMSYAAVDTAANQLAWRLHDLGVAPEATVAVCLEPSADLVVALLGVLKVGGTFVYLGPAESQDWLDSVLADARPVVVVSHTQIVGRLAVAPGATVLLLDRAPEGPSAHSSGPPALGASPETLASIVYTPGLSGRPVGIGITHRSVCNQLRWLQDRVPLEAGAGVLQQTPFGHATALRECLWPLGVGARLVLPRRGGNLDPSYLLQLLVYERIDTVHCTPSMLRELLDETGAPECEGVRQVLCSGETFGLALESRCREVWPWSRFSYLYDTAEAGAVTLWDCQGEGKLGYVPIGRPVDNVRLYLLDDCLEPVPLEVPGELYIGGEQVMRGYLGWADRTAQRLVPDPFGQPGDRLFRTGDLARYWEDGTIELLGRMDQQVRVRGVRAALGQVEDALMRHSGVKAVVTTGVERIVGDDQVIAYVVPRQHPTDGGPDDPEALVRSLRSHAQWLLPPPVVPSAFVVLDRLPLAADGTLHRPGLPQPDLLARQIKDTPPRDDLERQIADIWGRVLHLERVGIYENFFDLGGHSLLAMQIVAQLREAYGVDLAVNVPFRYRTIADLAGYLSELGAGPRQ